MIPPCTLIHMICSLLQDVIMTNACSGAVNMCIEVLCDTGQNILIPSPGFGLYKCLCEARGIEVRLYRLMVSCFSVYYVLCTCSCMGLAVCLCSCCQLFQCLGRNTFSLPVHYNSGQNFLIKFYPPPFPTLPLPPPPTHTCT